jgi:uncharacterized lipoprotein
VKSSEEQNIKIMKKFILGFCLIAMLASCGSKNEQWEYKVVKVAGHEA